METVVCGYRGCQVTWWRPYKKNTLLKLYLGVARPKYDTLDFLMLYIFLCLFPISIWFWSCQRYWAMTSSLKMGRPVIECEPDGMQISASKSVGSQLAKDRVIAPSGGVYLSWGLVKTCSVAVIQMPYLSVVVKRESQLIYWSINVHTFTYCHILWEMTKNLTWLWIQVAEMSFHWRVAGLTPTCELYFCTRSMSKLTPQPEPHFSPTPQPSK